MRQGRGETCVPPTNGCNDAERASAFSVENEKIARDWQWHLPECNVAQCPPSLHASRRRGTKVLSSGDVTNSFSDPIPHSGNGVQPAVVHGVQFEITCARRTIATT